MKPHHQHRAVTKISSCQVYVISRRGIVQLGSSFGSILLLFPMRKAGAHADSRQGKSPALFLCNSPVSNTCRCSVQRKSCLIARG